MIENSIDYKFIQFKWQTYRVKKMLYVKNYLKLEKWPLPVCRYFGLFSRAARDPRLLFIPDIDLSKAHLLT